MVKLIIRDDDLNYFTKVEDIIKVYREIEQFPVSFALVPHVTDVTTKGACPETKGNTIPRWIGDNTELSNWLTEELRNDRIDVLMHGITHGYRFINGIKKSEMEWRDEPQLSEEISKIKKELEQLLDYNITVFVAPSNKITKYGINSVTKSGMSFSGIIPLGFERDFTIQNLYSYLKRMTVRGFSRIPYPGVLRYSDHLELNACGMYGFDYLKKLFYYCDKRDLPMAINVHYWHIRDKYDHYKDFFNFIKYAIDQGAQPITMSKILKQYKEKNEDS